MVKNLAVEGIVRWSLIAVVFLRFLTRMREIRCSGLQLFSISSPAGLAWLNPSE